MNDQNRPWYKEPYVFMLIAFPLSSIIVCTILITFATNTKDSLVRDNYYKEGLAMNQELQWDKKAKSWDIRAELVVKDNTATFVLLNSRQVAPSMLQLKLSHPTLATSDRDSLMQLTQEKQNGKPVYQGFIEDLGDGRYYVQVESPEQSWRLRNELYMAQGETNTLK
jgi:hypothetical protein